jgi:uncharacterized membrane protein YphA (DoxX/SURF4 family)
MKTHTSIEGFEPTSNQDGLRSSIHLLQVLARVTIGTIFCVSGCLKVININGFVESLTSYGLLPKSMIGVVALLLPHIELVLGLLFVFGIRTRLIAWILFFQLIAFTSFGFAAYIQGHAVDCGCFPVAGAKETIGFGFFLRNALLSTTCFLIAKSSGKSEASLSQRAAQAY